MAVAGWRERGGDILAFALAAYALYWVIGIVDPQIYRVSFLLIALAATFFVYPLTSGRFPAAVRIGADGLCIALALTALLGHVSIPVAPSTQCR